MAAAAVGLVQGVRIPMVHDEFAYLLMGETFAQGRLTNPTPPFWEHLEAYHVLMQPTYMGKYPPGQGLVLTVGTLLGHPIIGVWLSVGFMVGAATWMTQAWLSHRWAVLVGAAVLVQLGLAGPWAQSYWGGALTAGAGALLYGAFRRAWTRPTAWLGAACATGLLLLANTRPMEGFVASLPVLACLPAIPKATGRRAFLTTTAVLLAAGATWMGVYNKAVTGTPFRLPYQEHHDQYAVASNFIFAPTQPVPDYRHPEFRQFWVAWDLGRKQEMGRLPGFLSTRAVALARMATVLLGGASLGLFLLRGAGGPWLTFLIVGSVPPILLTLLTKGAHPHYLAPVAPLLMLIAAIGWAHKIPRGRPSTRRLEAAAVTLLLWAPVAQQVRAVQARSNAKAQYIRADFERCLTALPYSSVVLVDYLGDFGNFDDWVRNTPDPFSAPVTWARGIDPSRDASLMEAFPEKAFWEIDVTRDEEALTISGGLLRLPWAQGNDASLQRPDCTPGT